MRKKSEAGNLPGSKLRVTAISTNHAAQVQTTCDARGTPQRRVRVFTHVNVVVAFESPHTEPGSFKYGTRVVEA